MTTGSFTTTILTDKPPSEVFNAIMNVRGWWQGEVEGPAEKAGDEFSYRMKEIHFSRQKLVEIIPGKKIIWEVTGSHLDSFTNGAEWTGTKIIFDISEVNGKTQVCFTHAGLVPALECYGSCSWAWEQLIQKSLLSLVDTGKGVNVFG